MRFVVVHGNPWQGFSIIGSFVNSADAKDYADDSFHSDEISADYWVMELNPPKTNGRIGD